MTSKNVYGNAYGVITFGKMGRIQGDRVIWEAKRTKAGRIGLALYGRYHLLDKQAYDNYMIDWLADGTVKPISK